jgi:hypothetical protein
MSPTGLETAAGAPSEAELERQVQRGATSRRLLRAVEQYRAACAARGVAPTEDARWSVFLTALAGESPGTPSR